MSDTVSLPGQGVSLKPAGAGSGTVTSIIAGTGLNGGTITTTGSLSANYQAGTLTTFGTGITLTSGTLTPNYTGAALSTIGNGLVLNSGTISQIKQGTIAGGGAITITPTSGTTSVLINGGTTDTTINLNTGFVDQRILLNFKQGATAHGVTLGAQFTGTLTSTYTATATASARDLLQVVCMDGSNWALTAISQGYTV